jgi:RecB family exonuclease
VTVYSHSRLETFRKCPRQFYYRYIAFPCQPTLDAPLRAAIEFLRPCNF